MYQEHAAALPTGVTLFTSVSPGPADQAVLVIHGGPDWDHTYLRDPRPAPLPGPVVQVACRGRPARPAAAGITAMTVAAW